MKKSLLLPALIVAAPACFAFATAGASDATENDVSDTALISDEPVVTVFDTLYSEGNRIVSLDFIEGKSGRDVSSDMSIELKLICDGEVLSSCEVGSSVSNRIIDDDSIRFIVGPDTTRAYPLMHLPRFIDPVADLAVGDIRQITFYKSFSVVDGADECELAFNGYLPKQLPLWLIKFLFVQMSDDINGLYADLLEKPVDRLKHYQQLIDPSRGCGKDTYFADLTPDRLASDMQRLFEKSYRQMFERTVMDNGSDPETEAKYAPKYDYSITVSPVWESADGQLVTYRVYVFYHTGGMHGIMEENYYTFEISTGKMLGFNDFFAGNEAQMTIDELTRVMVAGLSRDWVGYDFESVRAEIMVDENLSCSNDMFTEFFNGKLYPRPAMTRNGLLFSYQPYVKAPFVAGILHFVVPFSAK